RHTRSKRDWSSDVCSSDHIVGCEALENTKAAPAWDVFEMLFSEYGLPSTIRSDNGVPFASPGLAGLTTLSVKWLRLGIRLERIGDRESGGEGKRGGLRRGQ